MFTTPNLTTNVSTVGDSVGGWSDTISNYVLGNSATYNPIYPNPGTYETSDGPNGYAYVRLHGPSYQTMLTSTATDYGASYHVWALVKFKNAIVNDTDQPIITTTLGATQSPSMHAGQTVGAWGLHQRGLAYRITAPLTINLNLNKWMLIDVYKFADGNAGFRISDSINGSVETTGTIELAPNWTGMRLLYPSFAGASAPFDSTFEIAELKMCNTVLTGQDRTDALDYFNTKFNLGI